MAEITKVSSPLIPKENIGSKFKPVTDQAFELNDPGKVNKAAAGQEGKIAERQADNQNIFKDSMGRAAILPLLKDTGELLDVFRKVALLVQVGVSATDATTDMQARELLKSLFLAPDEMQKAVVQQDNASVLFKGEVFGALRDILAKFGSVPEVRDAVANLLKAFENNVNADQSIKTILYSCKNLLDYMFSKDREQFSDYLKGLSELVLPEAEKEAGKQNAARGEAAVEMDATKDAETAGKAQNAAQDAPLSKKEIANLLKSNLLPLLGEIVVKYNQNDKIRDTVMAVVHNIVRADQGTPEALRDAVHRLIQELRDVAKLPEDFEQNLLEAVKAAAVQSKSAENDVMGKITEILKETIQSSAAGSGAARQSENILTSILQNQSAVMDVLHFILPMQTSAGQVLTEIYVDPETDEHVAGAQGKSRKVFISVESEAHGAFELGFLATDAHVDFTMWCPETLVKSLSGMKRHFADIMQVHGYTMNSFMIDEMREPHSVAEVFPRLLERKVGVDVRI